MKRPIILSAFILAIAVSEGFASNQSVVKESRDVSGFTKVNFGVSGNVSYEGNPKIDTHVSGSGKVRSR